MRSNRGSGDSSSDVSSRTRHGAASIEAARRQVVASEEAYRVRRERFLAGSAISTDLTDAERDLFSARLAVINANIDLRESVARLRRAVGQRER